MVRSNRIVIYTNWARNSRDLDTARTILVHLAKPRQGNPVSPRGGVQPLVGCAEGGFGGHQWGGEDVA